MIESVSLPRQAKILLLFLYITTAIGCGTQTTNTNEPSGNLAVNTQPAGVNTSPAMPEMSESSASVPVTLPVMDAMFADEAFANEAKSSLQITDQEIQRLKDISRNAVLQLNDDGIEDDERSTKSSSADAKKKIEEVLGADKASKFISMIQRKWNGQDEGGTTASAPSSVPTDTRVVVNAPAYRMDIFKEGKLHKSYKIGIGYPEFPLPQGLRKASSIIFNPTWTPPDEPWVKGKVQPGKKVEAGSKDNPLGPIKIPIGLPSLIHGGKAPARLGTFASHGCVGLTSPQIQDFAFELAAISGQNISLADIKGYEKAKTETKDVKLANAVPVELRYETITVEDGVLKIYRDVYERGTNSEDNLQRVLQSFGVSFDGMDQAQKEKILAGLKQMAIDAQGDPVDSSAAANSNSNSNSNNDGKVTRNIKGKKEISFELPQLKGKGYPAAVGMKM
ncbi:MAG: L,D-transpeptidase [Pyrinomonadaceae bacterium]